MLSKWMLFTLKHVSALLLAGAVVVWLLWPDLKRLYQTFPPPEAWENPVERAFQRLSDEDKLRVVALEQQRRLEAQQRQDPRCQDKHLCKDMATCEEARFYLTTCGLKRLDRDGDGVPCEKLCR